jgi:hypothetical protein
MDDGVRIVLFIVGLYVIAAVGWAHDKLRKDKENE